LGREVIKEGKTINEAVDLACAQLGVTQDEVSFEVLELPKRGFWGLKTMAKVKVVVGDSVSAVAESAALVACECRKAEKKEEASVPDLDSLDSDDRFQKAVAGAFEYLKGILENFGVDDLSFSTEQVGEISVINIITANASVQEMVEYNCWEFVVALQQLVNVFLSKKCHGVKIQKVMLNFNNHMAKRAEEIKGLALNMMKVVSANGIPSSLKPMTSYERRLVHDLAATVEGISSKSVGAGDKRRVVLAPAGV
jgi:spoIIIJ-associated protein